MKKPLMASPATTETALTEFLKALQGWKGRAPDAHTLAPEYRERLKYEVRLDSKDRHIPVTWDGEVFHYLGAKWK